MAHVMKHTKASCGHMLSHYDRKAEHISNENIDRTRTHLNYNLATHQTMSQGDFIRKRCSEVHCQNRKDVNVMVSWIVTVPKDIPENEHKQFFQESYNFLSDRYGKDNVISAYVHMDEVTPHLHFAFVPVIRSTKKKKKKDDKKTELIEDYYKVSAKEVITRTELKTFHGDLQHHLEKALGHKVDILNDATKDGNKSIDELKRKSADERLQEVELEATEIINKANKEAQAIKDSLLPVRAEFDAKTSYIAACDKSSEVSMMYPSYAEKKKNLFGKETVTVPKEKWEEKHVSADEKSYLKKATDELEKKIAKFYETTSFKRISHMEEEIKALRTKNLKLSQEVDAEKTRADELWNKINKVLKSLPSSEAENFKNKWNSMTNKNTPKRNK